jgi:hypothetical protein
MAMKLLSFHNQLVADLSPYEQDYHHVALDIIQATQVSCAQFELGQRIGPQPFDRFRGDRGLMPQASQDRCLQASLVSRGQGADSGRGVYRE